MEAKKQENYSVTIPLLLDSGYEGKRVEDHEQYTNINNASFISTCFNCLNSLSGDHVFINPLLNKLCTF